MGENQRNLALDVFRGMTVCFMIIVNTPGDWSHVFTPLHHAPWHGFTATDLVFPSFLFAVGNAMAFSMKKLQGQEDSVFWLKTIKRTVIIFLIGYLLYWFPFINFETMSLKPLAETRILGVLQRIALCYFIAAIVIHYGSRSFAFWFSVVTLLAYWVILYAYGDANDPYSMAGYVGNDLDLRLLGEKHLYHGEGVAFDPEGILSTLPSIVNVIAGFLVGDYIRTKGNNYEAISKMMMAGAVLILIALTWHMVFPINKKIWTSSFVLLTVGLDLILLAILVYVIEMRKKHRWTYFFVVFGRNPLFIYALSGILIEIMGMIPVGDSNLSRWIYRDIFGAVTPAIVASFLFALFYMFLNWLVGYFLDKKRLYIRV